MTIMFSFCILGIQGKRFISLSPVVSKNHVNFTVDEVIVISGQWYTKNDSLQVIVII